MGVYCYIFYRIYRLLEKAEMPWWSDFRAAFLLAAIEGLLLALLNLKVSKYLGFGDAIELGKWGYIVVIGGPPIIFNYFIFQHKDRWKEIVNYFDEADEKEKRKRGIEMSLVILLIAGIFIFLMWL